VRAALRQRTRISNSHSAGGGDCRLSRSAAGLTEILARRETAGEAAGYDRLRAEREAMISTPIGLRHEPDAPAPKARWPRSLRHPPTLRVWLRSSGSRQPGCPYPDSMNLWLHAETLPELAR